MQFSLAALINHACTCFCDWIISINTRKRKEPCHPAISNPPNCNNMHAKKRIKCAHQIHTDINTNLSNLLIMLTLNCNIFSTVKRNYIIPAT